MAVDDRLERDVDAGQWRLGTFTHGPKLFLSQAFYRRGLSGKDRRQPVDFEGTCSTLAAARGISPTLFSFLGLAHFASILTSNCLARRLTLCTQFAGSPKSRRAASFFYILPYSK
eukprot:GHVT01086421.1.p1 GENE.GHVT01086421.1~~GHVT01086421.1.p1  ORF type:complete len:115 (+),score=13.05 GHVT01086421.1:489-833(+)